MPLDGLRAWIGEVERKLGMRTRVFLVLATIAIGGAGAAIYIALDTRDNAVSESDVRDLQERLEEQIASGADTTTPTPGPAPEPVEPTEPQPEPAPAPEPGEGPSPEPGPGPGDDATGRGGGADTDGALGADAAGSKARLRELIEEARRREGKVEAGQSE